MAYVLHTNRSPNRVKMIRSIDAIVRVAHVRGTFFESYQCASIYTYISLYICIYVFIHDNNIEDINIHMHRSTRAISIEYCTQ